MSVEEIVRNSELLLKQLAEEPETVLKALSTAERTGVVSILQDLSIEAAEARSEADLLYVANRVRRLVEKTPALAAQLSLPNLYPTRRRGVSASNHQAEQRESRYAQERAAQIRNHIVECQQRLSQALQTFPHRENGGKRL